MGEVVIWLDWWLSTLSNFGESLPEEAHSNFQWLMVSGAKSLEFLGSQTTPVLANLVLLQRDPLLSDIRSTVPAEELSRLRHAPLPPSSALFPPTLLDMALSKIRATSNNTLVQGPRSTNRKSKTGRHLRQPRRRIGPGSRPSFPINDRHRVATPVLPPRQEAIPVNPARGRSHFSPLLGPTQQREKQW